MIDPFAQVVNESAQSGRELRDALLEDSRRGYTVLRKIFVQQPQEAVSRPSILGEMVNARQEVALRLYLLILGLEPLGADLKVPAKRWANMLGACDQQCTSAQFHRALKQLEERRLVSADHRGRQLNVSPLLEDGSGGPYVRPSAKGADVGKGYFSIPDAFWTTGLVDQLRLPGLAMFLVCLHDTSQEPSFQVSLEQMAGWYGISERTSERGYAELAKADVLLTRVQTVRDKRQLSGLRTVTWRALKDPYSQDARARAQAASRSASRKKAQRTNEP